MLEATKNSIWDACVWQISTITACSWVSLRDVLLSLKSVTHRPGIRVMFNVVVIMKEGKLICGSFIAIPRLHNNQF